MVPSITGEKQLTIRKYRQGAHDFKKGESFVGEFADGLRILLTATADTLVKTFGDLTDEEAQEDGFRNSDDAFDGLGEYYPGLTETDQMAVVRYKIWEFEETPVVSPV